jgi:hypothetical protein
MTTQRDPDLIIAAWLDEHAVPLPETTQRAIDVSIRSTPQRGRLLWLPRRTSSMTSLLRPGLIAVAIVVVAIGSFTFLRQGPAPGVAASPTPSVSSSPAPDPSTWETFTSERYGYQVGHPGWDVYPATGQYVPGVDNDDQVVSDRITVGAGFSGLYSSSTAVDAGMAPEQWVEQYVCPCEQFGEWISRTVDGQPTLQAVSSGGEQTIDLYVFTGERVYRFIGVNVLVRDQPLWEAFVSTIRLHPEDAVDEP